MSEQWVIIKRGLYYRDACKGYTGIRDEAGRYSHDFALRYAEHDDDITIMPIDSAPEFMPAAHNDLVIKHLQKQRDEARTDLADVQSALRGAKLLLEKANSPVRSSYGED